MSNNNLKQEYLDEFFNDKLNDFINDVESMVEKPLIMSDVIEQAFETEPYDPECWIDFTSYQLKEVNYTPNNADCLELIFNVNNDDVIYFIPFNQLNNLKQRIEDDKIEYEIETIDNQIYWNIK